MLPRPADHENAERQRQARDRIERQTRHLRWSRWADREMSLADYYRSHHPALYCRVVEGWRAA